MNAMTEVYSMIVRVQTEKQILCRDVGINYEDI